MSINLISRNQTRSISFYKVKNWYANLVKPKPLKPPYKHVTQIGDPILRTVAEKVDISTIKSDNIQKILAHMVHVFDKYKCIGLAAPQLGVPLQIILIEFNKQHMKLLSKEEVLHKEVELVPFSIIINPEVTIKDFAKKVYPESCESIKGFWADVPRYYAISLQGYNENGEQHKLEAKGWTARIIQHEIDHLNGRMYTDIMDRKSLTCGCWEIINERNGKVNLPFGSS